MKKGWSWLIGLALVLPAGAKIAPPSLLAKSDLTTFSLEDLSNLEVTSDSKTPEKLLKAAFLYNFAKFVEWPAPDLETSSGTFSLCMIGDDPFRQDLDEQLAEKPIQDKTLTIKRLARSGDMSGCQMVFISASEAGHLDTILQPLEGKPVLTVSDMPRFIQGGGMVGFSLVDNKVRELRHLRCYRTKTCCAMRNVTHILLAGGFHANIHLTYAIS